MGNRICSLNSCCEEYEMIKTCENYFFITDDDTIFKNIDEQIYLKNGKTIDSYQLILSKQYFKVINEIRESPTDYLNESKSHNLFDIFLKLKPNEPLKYSDKNILDIIYYLMESQEQTSIIERENEIKILINDGHLTNINLFKSITIGNDVRENFWYFLQENEDDIDKIFSDNYEYIMIICLPIANDKSVLFFIFYSI